ncbi:MAG: hypothetical protein AAF847_09435 [Bacteroidota bacterium]
MTNVEIANKIHELAMELADIADIAKMKGKNGVALQNLSQAYILERAAALRLQNEPDENEWKYLYLKSAAWLAYQLGCYQEALQLTDLGLSGTAKGVALHRLKEVKSEILKKISEEETTPQKSKMNVPLYGILASADVEQELIKFKETKKQVYYSLRVPKHLIQKTIRHLIGEWVEINVSTNEDGVLVLDGIRRAA